MHLYNSELLIPHKRRQALSSKITSSRRCGRARVASCPLPSLLTLATPCTAMARGRIRLSGSGPDSSTWEPFKRTLSKLFAARTRDAVGKAVFKSFRVEGAPLKVRPASLLLLILSRTPPQPADVAGTLQALILLTILVLLLLSVLGFHPTLANRISPPVPFSDKLLHFVAFALASLTFYGVWVVDRTRREWYWRWWNEGLSLGVCTVAGGIGSEWVQGLLPYKTVSFVGDSSTESPS